MNGPYLSKIEINPQRRGARHLLGSQQAMHAAIMASFPPAAHRSEQPGRPLWRLDSREQENTLLVSSPSKPDFTHLVEQAGWPASDQKWVTRSMQPLMTHLQDDQIWEFRFCGNPVHQGLSPEGERKRFGHVTVNQQLEWFAERAKNLGLRLLQDEDDNLLTDILWREKTVFNKRGPSGSHRVVLNRVTFQGAAKVENADQVRHTLVHGYGHGKAYGCGLLTLAPLPTTVTEIHP